jgi:hypothetical protein
MKHLARKGSAGLGMARRDKPGFARVRRGSVWHGMAFPLSDYPPNPIEQAQADLLRAKRLGDELLANLLVIAVLLLTLAVVMSLND